MRRDRELETDVQTHLVQFVRLSVCVCSMRRRENNGDCGESERAESPTTASCGAMIFLAVMMVETRIFESRLRCRAVAVVNFCDGIFFTFVGETSVWAG